MTRIYRNPFAFNGDKVDIAESSQPDGRISIEDGWTTDYELPEGEPNYKPVERDEMNGIFNEVTQAVGEIQLNGFPVWQSLPGGWPSLAIVRHGNDVWRSTKDSNGSTPGVNEDWTNISFMSPGEGGGQVRTNEQNEQKFVTTDTDQAISGHKEFSNYTIIGGDINSGLALFVGPAIASPDFIGTGSAKVCLSRATPGADFPFNETGNLIIKPRGNEPREIALMTGVGVGALRGYISRHGGFVWGDPAGANMGAGSINAEALFVNSNEVWHGGNLDFQWDGSSGTLNIVTNVGNFMSPMTNDEPGVMGEDEADEGR